MTTKTFKDGVELACRTVLAVIDTYYEKPSDDLQKDLKSDIKCALDKILAEP
ncbi:unnamed protein product [marine sediment metagenome]|uniref:Uncharacterized protein n=1 Tax=marine sediment metagenome TaxID=412755 RepID=X1E144_9ZZZZ